MIKFTGLIKGEFPIKPRLYRTENKDNTQTLHQDRIPVAVNENICCKYNSEDVPLEFHQRNHRSRSNGKNRKHMLLKITLLYHHQYNVSASLQPNHSTTFLATVLRIRIMYPILVRCSEAHHKVLCHVSVSVALSNIDVASYKFCSSSAVSRATGCLPVAVQVEFLAVLRPRDVDGAIAVNVTVQHRGVPALRRHVLRRDIETGRL